jgi:hypothetical protein
MLPMNKLTYLFAFKNQINDQTACFIRYDDGWRIQQ